MILAFEQLMAQLGFFTFKALADGGGEMKYAFATPVMVPSLSNAKRYSNLVVFIGVYP